ncbi:hypothetical protein [Caldivirga sp.]|uniref:hypothetical protein n=1 Tax=Caldivirga sp. TaxID=2080243 RepID=UPI003D13BC2F
MLSITAVIMGLYAGLTVYIGFITIRLKGISIRQVMALNAMAIGILGYIDVDLTSDLLSSLNDVIGKGPWLSSLTYVTVVGFSALVTLLALSIIEDMIKGTRVLDHGGDSGALALSFTTAVGIGLHNLGEGLGIGAMLLSANLSLATLLSFAIHNATEGFAIAAPLLSINGGTIKDLRRIMLILGAIAGLPTSIGALILVNIPINRLAVVCSMAIAVASITYVIVNIIAE